LVRDIWKDGSGSSSADRQKQSDEFHTIAVVGEREGGRHYTAIDITDTSSNPKYLWTWPPRQQLRAGHGRELERHHAKPPPIGPVLIQDNSGPITVTVGGSPVKASERWVVASPADSTRTTSAAAPSTSRRLGRHAALQVQPLRHGELQRSPLQPRPVLAPVSLIDSNYDNFFDLAVLGDTEGQLFTIDMLNPALYRAG